MCHVDGSDGSDADKSIYTDALQCGRSSVLCMKTALVGQNRENYIIKIINAFWIRKLSPAFP
jgi:hypothetical protein